MNIRLFFATLFAASLANAQPAAPDAPPAKPDNPPAAPAEAKTEMQKWIEATDAQWQAAFKREVSDVHEAELNKVKLQFLTSLEDGIKKASAANDLKGALALRNEQKRFGDTQVFPEKDEDEDAAAVKAVRAAIRVQLAQFETKNAGRAKALHARYDQVLAQAQTQLTKAQRLDDAQLVQTKREEVAAAWITPAIAAVAEEKKTPTAPVTPPKPAPAAKGGSKIGESPGQISVKLKIVSATYGAGTRTVDITDHLRKLYESGEQAVFLTTRFAAEGRDPAPSQKKEVTINYEIHGKAKTKTFAEAQNLHFKTDLQ